MLGRKPPRFSFGGFAAVTRPVCRQRSGIVAALKRRAKGQRPNWDKRGLLSHDGLWRGGEAFAVRLGAPKNPLSFHFHFTAQPLRNHTTTKKPPPKHHTPRSACGLSYKGTSLGLRLDLTASRAGPAWGKGGSTFTGRGIAPLPTRRPLRGGAGATHLPSTCKHWQVIVVAPARGGFVFISWRGGAAGRIP